MSDLRRPQPDVSPAAPPQQPQRGERAGVPEPSRIEWWLRTLTGFENARVVDVEPLTDGLSNVTCRLRVTDGPLTTAVLRIQPTHGIFEPYDVLREGRVLSHLADAAVPVPALLAAESDPQLVGVVDWEQALISDPRSDVGQLVALSHLRGAAPYGPPRENPFVQLYEASTGEPLESMELFRARWLFQLGVVYHGWKAYGTEPWFSWAQIQDLLARSLAER
jgi:aminoglycoside phosphotransferase (APT) family kinase protein